MAEGTTTQSFDELVAMLKALTAKDEAEKAGHEGMAQTSSSVAYGRSGGHRAEPTEQMRTVKQEKSDAKKSRRAKNKMDRQAQAGRDKAEQDNGEMKAQRNERQAKRAAIKEQAPNDETMSQMSWESEGPLEDDEEKLMRQLREKERERKRAVRLAKRARAKERKRIRKAEVAAGGADHPKDKSGGGRGGNPAKRGPRQEQIERTKGVRKTKINARKAREQEMPSTARAQNNVQQTNAQQTNVQQTYLQPSDEVDMDVYDVDIAE